MKHKVKDAYKHETQIAAQWGIILNLNTEYAVS